MLEAWNRTVLWLVGMPCEFCVLHKILRPGISDIKYDNLTVIRKVPHHRTSDSDISGK